MVFKAEIYSTDIVTQVYNQLRKAIFSESVFKVGEKINIDKLSQDWEVSKTPIREALKFLEQESIIKHIPRKGFFISVLEVDELKDLADLRLALEIHALKRGFEWIDRERLKGFLIDFKKAHDVLLREQKVEPYLEIDDEFHYFLIQSGQNRKMAEVYENMKNSLKLLRIRDTFGSEANMGATLPEHEEIIHAIIGNDKEKAIDSLTNHLNNVENRLYTQ
ncbi:GntR family transcriptional regulator [bacterium]|nr:GntR family transcriptional regulator [bacterium]